MSRRESSDPTLTHPAEIVEAQPRGGHRLWLRFADRSAGEVDLDTHMAFDGIFAALADPEAFATVKVDPEAGTVVWPNGADLDPDVLCAAVTGKPIDLRGVA